MKTEKIPCSVSLLTLNVEDSLPACLDSLKDFQEIIVCDGNSTDRTQEIAARYGTRVIKQYDTDEPNVRCDMDKATVRQRAMDASTLPWRFFMDADDTLSPEAVQEIRTIVTGSNQNYSIWRMPTRIFIDGTEIKHEATYPSYQTRLVHERVDARFKGPVHDHLVWDTKKFPVGTMKNYYNFHWPKERVESFWMYQKAYARRELTVQDWGGTTFVDMVRWTVLWRFKIIVGYVFWRLPLMYFRYGFKDSMPLSLEIQIVGYHIMLLFGGVREYVKARFFQV